MEVKQPNCKGGVVGHPGGGCKSMMKGGEKTLKKQCLEKRGVGVEPVIFFVITIPSR